MKRFVEGADRGQSTLLPECLEDWIDANNPVRVIDAFVDALDLAELGFNGVAPAATGRPAYHPSALLKFYIYGHLNRVQSSRRLEREGGRNVEVMWLLSRLVPAHKTIADFRKDNGSALRQVCARFVELCRELGLALLERNCSRCHAVAPGAESPRKEAPNLSIVLESYPAERLQSELAEGIRPKHREMPQVRFSPSDIANIYYYLHGKTPESEYRRSQ
jgi:transposase